MFLRRKLSDWPHVEAEIHECRAGTSNGAQMLQVGSVGKCSQDKGKNPASYRCVHACVFVFGPASVGVCMSILVYCLHCMRECAQMHAGLLFELSTMSVYPHSAWELNLLCMQDLFCFIFHQPNYVSMYTCLPMHVKKINQLSVTVENVRLYRLDKVISYKL